MKTVIFAAILNLTLHSLSASASVNTHKFWSCKISVATTGTPPTGWCLARAAYNLSAGWISTEFLLPQAGGGSVKIYKDRFTRLSDGSWQDEYTDANEKIQHAPAKVEVAGSVVKSISYTRFLGGMEDHSVTVFGKSSNYTRTQNGKTIFVSDMTLKDITEAEFNKDYQYVILKTMPAKAPTVSK